MVAGIGLSLRECARGEAEADTQCVSRPRGAQGAPRGARRRRAAASPHAQRFGHYVFIGTDLKSLLCNATKL